MRTKTLILSVLAVLFLAAAGMAYAFRGAIRDTIAVRAKPALPDAQPYVPAAQPTNEPHLVTEPAPSTVPSPTPKPTPPPAPTPEPKPIAKGVNLAVPFTSQAPKADWSMPYQEACEEASLIMVNAYLTNAGAFTAETADAQILVLVEWEKNRFGYYEDTTAEEVATIARERFGFAKSRAVKVASLDEVKAQLEKGLPVLVPAAGRLLHNPNFSGAGPLYHMLVVKGYTKDGKIITNDPGTRRGADYLYDPDVLWNALHDWNGGDVENGPKMMVVMAK